METLMELVAASFERHGIECKPADSRPFGAADPHPSHSSTDKVFATALPDHNYRQIAQGDPSP